MEKNTMSLALHRRHFDTAAAKEKKKLPARYADKVSDMDGGGSAMDNETTLNNGGDEGGDASQQPSSTSLTLSEVEPRLYIGEQAAVEGAVRDLGVTHVVSLGYPPPDNPCGEAVQVTNTSA